MEKIKLDRTDWETAKAEAKAQIRQGLMLNTVGTLLLNKAEKEIEKYGEEEDKAAE